MDSIKDCLPTTKTDITTNSNFNYQPSVEHDVDFGNNDKEYMLKLATDINAFKSHFDKLNELTKNNNIVFSKSNDNRIIPKTIDLCDNLSSSPSQSCNIFTETTTHIVSSDTGLATSMESFQLLSSDPVEPEDTFWLPKSLTSFNNQNNTTLNQPNSFNSFIDKESNSIKDKNNNSNIFFNNNYSDRNIFSAYKSNDNNTTDFTDENYKGNIFLNYERAKQKENFKDDKKEEKNDNNILDVDFNTTSSKPPILLEKSESVLLSEDTKNLCISTDSKEIIEKAKPGLYIVGGNENMSLGLGDNITEVPVFTQIKCLADVEYVSSGEDYCFAIEAVKEKVSNGSNDVNYVWSFGNNTHGTLGYPGNYSTPQRVDFFNEIKIVQIFCGPEICIFRSIEGNLYMTGTYTNDSGEVIKTEEPIQLLQFDIEVIDVSASKGYVYAISKDHKLYYWNYNKNLAHLKILNDGKKDNQEVTEYVVMQDDKKVKISRVFSGKYHAFLLDEENRVYGFGANQWGQLGTTFDTDEEKPVLINELIHTPIKEIACGNFHSLFLSNNGTVFACGKNDRYQIGFNSGTGSVLIPKELKPIKNCIHIACGANHSLAIVDNNYYKNIINSSHETTADNKLFIKDSSDSQQYILYGWGDGESYNLGTGSNTCKNILKSIDFKIFVNKFCRPRRVSMQIKTVKAGNGFTLLLTK
jgi:alpha-tubulin suppressor-like RCC1 family protein